MINRIAVLTPSPDRARARQVVTPEGKCGRAWQAVAMIRNVVLGRLNDGVELRAVEPGIAAIAALRPEGLIDCKVGLDARIREGCWDFAITSDFVDEASYHGYDHDEEHNRIRRELIGPLCAEIARVQFAC
jgi:hypothetical protein